MLNFTTSAFHISLRMSETSPYTAMLEFKTRFTMLERTFLLHFLRLFRISLKQERNDFQYILNKLFKINVRVCVSVCVCACGSE